jgi:hypothetical protein
MGKFELTERIGEKNAVENINYSILLSYVFGKPINAEQAFMYFFRRFGLPNDPHDDYKELCSYAFSTDDEKIIVRWGIVEGDYHYHLYAFTDWSEYWAYEHKPICDYYNQLREAAEKDGLVYFGGHAPFCLWKHNNGETKFIGNEIQRAAVDKICEDYSDNNEETWNKVFDRMNKNDKEIKERYKTTIPYPPLSDRIYEKISYQDCHKNQIEAGKIQHEWILSLPEDHFLRRVYFAAMRLFEDWKQPTYIRDQYFNLSCEVKDMTEVENGVGYTDFFTQIEKLQKPDARGATNEKNAE